MLKAISCLVLFCTLSSSQPFPFPAPVSVPLPIAPPVAPVLAVAPFTPTPRPLVPGLPGYNNPYYNQYNRIPGVSVAPRTVPGAVVPILTYSSEHAGDGSYAFSFTTADGKQAQETGYLKDAYIDNAGEPQGTQVVQGSYAYISPEGTPIQVSYIADENGFRPSGVHIPADGKTAVPFIAERDKQIIDPIYNRYDPFVSRNQYTSGKYNGARPYNPRYPHETSKYNPLYNNYNPYVPGVNKDKNESNKAA